MDANEDFVVLGGGLFDVLDLDVASAIDGGFHVRHQFSLG
jgi:hypothetical protein